MATLFTNCSCFCDAYPGGLSSQAFQVIGIREDGAARIALSDISCSDLNESDLDEFSGVMCAGKPVEDGRVYETLVDGKWYQINHQADFNENGKIESGELARSTNPLS